MPKLGILFPALTLNWASPLPSTSKVYSPSSKAVQSLFTNVYAHKRKRKRKRERITCGVCKLTAFQGELFKFQTETDFSRSTSFRQCRVGSSCHCIQPIALLILAFVPQPFLFRIICHRERLYPCFSMSCCHKRQREREREKG